MALKKQVAKNDDDKIKCMSCRKLKVGSSHNYYLNKNPLFDSDKFEVCKDCIAKYIGNKDSDGYIDRVILVLSNMDKPLLVDIWTSSERDWPSYIRQISSFYKDLNFSDSTYDFTKVNNNNVNYNNSSLSEDTFDDQQKFYSAKWMGEYSKSDIEYLESYYTGLDRDFKIVTTNHKDYAKKIAKASLHMDKCFQDMLAGSNGADKRYKDAKEVFDTLSKSAQFSESQRGQNDVSLGCFGVTFDQVEQHKWIPKHHALEQDSYDKIISQFATIKESV
ncbi:hypothetical protein [Paenibacillus spiritus]|nr:hypothetical protein [Paenibacillus spiritus]